MAKKKNYYEILGVSRNASLDEIKRAYRKLAMQYHPDKNNGSKRAENKFKSITEAYNTLSNERERALYDAITFGETYYSNFEDANQKSDFNSYYQNSYREKAREEKTKQSRAKTSETKTSRTESEKNKFKKENKFFIICIISGFISSFISSFISGFIKDIINKYTPLYISSGSILGKILYLVSAIVICLICYKLINICFNYNIKNEKHKFIIIGILPALIFGGIIPIISGCVMFSIMWVIDEYTHIYIYRYSKLIIILYFVLSIVLCLIYFKLFYNKLCNKLYKIFFK